MKKHLWLIVSAVILVAAIVVGGVLLGQKNDLQKQVDDLTAKIATLEKDLATAKEEVATAEAEAAEAAAAAIAAEAAAAEAAAAAAAAAAEAAAEAEAKANYKIGILTGTVSQNEEEYRAGEKEVAKTPDNVLLDTYPDNFMSEQEATISKLMSFAADPDVDAIIMCQAVPGAAPGFSKIREMERGADILLIGITPAEDPDVISQVADFTINTDEVGQGDLMMDLCAKWGVDVFIHYSFPRHMAYELIVARHELLVKNAEALGIEFVDVTAPDPTGEAGVPGAHQFIREDVPAQMEKYAGKKVAFFTTNCGMQVPLQEMVLAFPDAYYPSPCCPSPYHGFPSSLSLELNVADGNEAALKTVAEKLRETGADGRFSTWAAPVAMASLEVSAAYAREYIAGTITERNDFEALKRLYEEVAPGALLSPYTDANGVTFDNYYVVRLAPVDFTQY